MKIEETQPTMTSDIKKDIFQWDVRNWSRALPIWDKYICTSETLRCLEVGGYQGGLSLYMALHGHQVVCSDLTNPHQRASVLHNRYTLKFPVEYAALDALEIPYEEYFDVIAFKSVLGGIGRDGHLEKQEGAMQQMFKALKPGGTLLFAENLQASALHRFLRGKFQPWGKSWRYMKKEELMRALHPFAGREVYSSGFFGAFGKNESMRNALGVIDRVSAVLPDSFHYMAFGAATR